MDRGMKEAITRTCKRMGDMHATAEHVASLEARIAKLRAALESIAYHDGNPKTPFVDISRNAAVAGYRNNIHVAKKALTEDSQ